MSRALLIVAGLGGLLLGADRLVRGGAVLASHLGVRPIVVGLTVVALGTSRPELAVGIDAVRQGSPGLAVGNIVGTNLVDILLSGHRMSRLEGSAFVAGYLGYLLWWILA